jgi:hydroxymethylglutaryl-CoA lyase
MGGRQVEIVEVAPRDGLQNERTLLDTAAKVELVARSVAAGLRRVEVTAFVNPERVPQMADAEAVVAALRSSPGISSIGLVLNRRGLDRALAAGVDEVNYVVVATDTFSRRNQGVDTAAALAAWDGIAGAAHAAGIRVSVTIAAAFGCPFEGEVPVGRVAELAARVAGAGPDELALADTIGVGVPTDVTERLGAVLAAAGGVPLRCHFHNTRNTGIANAYAAVEAGAQALDASTGGIGGCPFAPAATGNIPTEDLAWMLGRMGVATGVSVPAVVETAAWLGERLGQTVPALLGKAGIFPPEGQPRA